MKASNPEAVGGDGTPANQAKPSEDDFYQYDDDHLNLEQPQSFKHLLHLLWTKCEKKMFHLSNPDGYFYLLYLKTLLKFFTINFLVAGSAMFFLCYYRNGLSERDSGSALWFNMFCFLYQLQDPVVYSTSLVLMVFTSVLAYIFLYHFCREMATFEFQPD